MRLSVPLVFLLVVLYGALVLRQAPARNACEILTSMSAHPPLLPMTIHLESNATAPAFTALFPEALVVVWNESDVRALMSAHYPEAEYRSERGRFFILHNHGGLYAAPGIVPLQNFWGALDPERVSLVQTPFAEADASLMAAPRHAAFWKHMTTEPLGVVARRHPGEVALLPCEVFMRLNPEHHAWGINLLAYTVALRSCGAYDAADPCMLTSAQGLENTPPALRGLE